MATNEGKLESLGRQSGDPALEEARMAQMVGQVSQAVTRGVQQFGQMAGGPGSESMAGTGGGYGPQAPVSAPEPEPLYPPRSRRITGGTSPEVAL